MPSLRPLLLALPVALLACEAQPERTDEARAPIVGGILDGFRTYVVGVGDESGAICTGTLISRRTVLTAGHCYTPGSPNGGITKITFGNDITAGGPAVAVDVAQAVRHPKFSDQTLSNDLTLVHLAADAPSQPAPLLRETMTNGPDFVGPNFTFSGYGNDGHYNYDVRRVAVFPIDRVGPASDVGLDTHTGPIDATMFYYRIQGKNTCDGDSGGPAFVVRDHVERLAGSTSYGDWSCVEDGVDARTDLPAITAFIQPTIDLFEGADPCRADGVCDDTCNVGGLLVDPDCAAQHCGADGICVLSCVDPPDPDCPAFDHAGADGVCDPTVTPVDYDCLPPPTPDAGAGGGGAGGAATGGGGASGGAGTGGGSTGGGGAVTHTATPPHAVPGEVRAQGGGCSASGTGNVDATAAFALSAAGLSLFRRRRRSVSAGRARS